MLLIPTLSLGSGLHVLFSVGVGDVLFNSAIVNPLL